MIQYHLRKLKQTGKATNSLVKLPATMTLNNSQSLAGHSSLISTLTANSKKFSLKIQLTKCCNRDLLTQKARRHAAFAVEKDDIFDLVSKAWNESFAHFDTNQKAVSEQGWVN